MRIIFLENHPMWTYGLPRGFKDIGCEVYTTAILSEAILRYILVKYKPDLVFSLGWTAEHSPEKQYWVRKYLSALDIPHIYWATEDPTHTESFTLPLLGSSKIDFIFTICPARVGFYKDMGLKAAHLDFAYHPATSFRTASESAYARQLAVVANAYPDILKKYPCHYRIESMRNLIKPLVKENFRIDFWGRDWNRSGGELGAALPSDWLHGYLDYRETNKVYSSADIILGLQNHRTQLSQRTYEILGAEGFLLTSDTQAVRQLFMPGRDLAVAASPEETVELVKYYLPRPAEREKIRKQGREAVEKAHTYRHRAAYIMETLKKEGIIAVG